MILSKRKQLRHIVFSVLALMLSLAVVFPLAYGFLGAFKTPEEFSKYPPTVLPEDFTNLENFSEAFKAMPFARYLLNSFVVALIASTFRLVFAILAAYAFAYYEFPGKKIIFVLVLATMIFPADTLLVTNYLTVSKMGLLDTYLGMCITSFVGASHMFILRQKFKTIPRDLHSAATVDGCGSMGFLFQIVLPVCRPLLVTLFVQSFLSSWNSYLWPLLVTNNPEMRTLQVGVTMMTSMDSDNYHIMLAGVTLTFLPSLILFVILQKNLKGGSLDGALKG